MRRQERISGKCLGKIYCAGPKFRRLSKVARRRAIRRSRRVCD